VFETINYLEAIFWCTIGIAFLREAISSSKSRRLRIVLGGALVAFGGSDIVEVETGAWWQPWWLFCWKAVCLLIIVHQFVMYVRLRKSGGR